MGLCVFALRRANAPSTATVTPSCRKPICELRELVISLIWHEQLVQLLHVLRDQCDLCSGKWDDWRAVLPTSLYRRWSRAGLGQGGIHFLVIFSLLLIDLLAPSSSTNSSVNDKIAPCPPSARRVKRIGLVPFAPFTAQSATTAEFVTAVHISLACHFLSIR